MNYLIDPVDLAYYLSIEEYQSITDENINTINNDELINKKIISKLNI